MTVRMKHSHLSKVSLLAQSASNVLQERSVPQKQLDSMIAQRENIVLVATVTLAILKTAILVITAQKVVQCRKNVSQANIKTSQERQHARPVPLEATAKLLE